MYTLALTYYKCACDDKVGTRVISASRSFTFAVFRVLVVHVNTLPRGEPLPRADLPFARGVRLRVRVPPVATEQGAETEPVVALFLFRAGFPLPLQPLSLLLPLRQLREVAHDAVHPEHRGLASLDVNPLDDRCEHQAHAEPLRERERGAKEEARDDDGDELSERHHRRQRHRPEAEYGVGYRKLADRAGHGQRENILHALRVNLYELNHARDLVGG
mmetsp:Transcript_12853/g.50298  ORF Transcript_12853/g.50298 Transcript_12853/m.50298 type:complete len:217 (-) Transcript_12853:1332-1982(-)